MHDIEGESSPFFYCISFFYHSGVILILNPFDTNNDTNDCLPSAKNVSDDCNNPCCKNSHVIIHVIIYYW